MDIIIKPEDLIKRCLWSKYKKFVLKNKTDDEINIIIQENKPERLKENDAYVIGLLKVVETENITHRFKLHIHDFLKIKSTINNDKVMINKSSLLKEMIEFKDMFPDAYKPDKIYQEEIDKMKVFVMNVYSQIEKFDTIEIVMRDNKTYTYILSNEVNKLIS